MHYRLFLYIILFNFKNLKQNLKKTLFLKNSLKKYI